MVVWATYWFSTLSDRIAATPWIFARMTTGKTDLEEGKSCELFFPLERRFRRKRGSSRRPPPPQTIPRTHPPPLLEDPPPPDFFSRTPTPTQEKGGGGAGARGRGWRGGEDPEAPPTAKTSPLFGENTLRGPEKPPGRKSPKNGEKLQFPPRSDPRKWRKLPQKGSGGIIIIPLPGPTPENGENCPQKGGKITPKIQFL